ncbi:M-phase inducer phosphatase-like [Mizuhopecten yessoensis]|uniref:M-phase inducer phosphatase n=1 Tax=Mizuhopecten yessoensis TaxID=6573 RepID=A0A210Q540_MIZYE|nr:M-phase inducer phosphatase-like [Mizuhopecten yessoensis]XP_021366947.1 M-phase inducer phosphatase-like [Mizuhopecten yessoensis]OWF43862.1 M-phase inducer phosphatase [Mizuhopecten yessoensis]
MDLKMFGTPRDVDYCLTSVNIDPDLLTPGWSASLRPMDIQDEDSGLGMDMTENLFKDEESTSLSIDTPGFVKEKVNPKSTVRKSLFSQKRTRTVEDGTLSSGKRQKCSESEDIVAGFDMLSFEDTATPPKCDSGFVIEAVNKFVEHDDITGNGSQPFCLPIIPGKHSDLKSITPNTLSGVLDGQYDDVIRSFRIIDCRYPYEFESGHIKGAENLYTNEMIEELLRQKSNPVPISSKRDIIIFHCEFSSARGPRMSRLLRKLDRELNSDRYPLLNYPEVYLLHEGYKAFYYSCQEHCEPMGYMPMLHSNHTSDLRHFRTKSKSWCVGDRRRGVQHRLKFSEY